MRGVTLGLAAVCLVAALVMAEATNERKQATRQSKPMGADATSGNENKEQTQGQSVEKEKQEQAETQQQQQQEQQQEKVKQEKPEQEQLEKDKESSVKDEQETEKDKEPTVKDEQETERDEEPSVKDEQETERDKEPSVKDEQETEKDKEPSVKDEQETERDKEPSVKDEQETEKDKEPSAKDKQETEKDKTQDKKPMETGDQETGEKQPKDPSSTEDKAFKTDSKVQIRKGAQKFFARLRTLTETSVVMVTSTVFFSCLSGTSSVVCLGRRRKKDLRGLLALNHDLENPGLSGSFDLDSSKDHEDPQNLVDLEDSGKFLLTAWTKSRVTTTVTMKYTDTNTTIRLSYYCRAGQAQLPQFNCGR